MPSTTGPQPSSSADASPKTRPLDGAEYAATVRRQAQELRRQTHAQLMQAFLPAEVFEPPERPALRAV